MSFFKSFFIFFLAVWKICSILFLTGKFSLTLFYMEVSMKHIVNRKGSILIAAFVFISLFGGGLSSVYAQEQVKPKEPKSAVYVDLGYLITGLTLGGFGLGLGYEHALLPRLSVRGAVSGIGYQADSSLTFLGFDIGAGVRYYPLGSAVAKFYLGGELAYSPISISYLDSEANSNIFSAALMAGWKIVFSNRFFMEPYIGYRAAMGELKLPSSIRSVSYNASGFMWGIGIGRTF
jgi:hypothetical protein